MRFYPIDLPFFSRNHIRNRQLDGLDNHSLKRVDPMDITDLPRDVEARWEWIKFQLRVRGCSPAELARQLGVTDRAIRAVKHAPYPRIEREIASRLGTSPQLLWPDRWDVDGMPRRQRPNRPEKNRLKRTLEDSGYATDPHCKTDSEF